jgi:peptidoglycan/LPS O-acetylase OafA/YrhL
MSSIAGLRRVLGNTSRPQTVGRRLDIQGLRAVAVLLVVSNHLLAWPTGGYIGVDVFFVISGFLITGNLMRERDRTGWIHLAGFYARRLRRILPVATVVAVVTVGVAYLLWFPLRANQAALDALSSLLWVSNWHFASLGTDYLASSGPVSPLQHYWSLSVEEQFYVFWPWMLIGVVWVGARLTKMSVQKTLLLGMAAIGCASFALALVLTSLSPTMAYFETLSRAWEFIGGAILALVGLRLEKLPHSLLKVLGGAGLVIIAAGAVLIDPRMPFPGPWALVPVLGSMLVIAGGARGAQTPILTNVAARWIGNVSYSLYLWHFPVIVFVESVFPEKPVWATALQLILMLSLSAVSYHFVEVPARESRWLRSWESRRKADRRRWKARQVLGASFLALVVIGLAALQVKGPAYFKDASAVGERQRSALYECRNTAGDQNPRECQYGPAGSEKTALVLGDSVAISWTPAVASALPTWNVIGLGFGNCSPYAVDTLPRRDTPGFIEACAESKQLMLGRAQGLRPDIVVLSSDLGAFERMANPSNAGQPETIWSNAVAKTVAKYQALGSRVVVLGSPPIGGDMRDCTTRLTDYENCGATIDTRWERKTAAERGGAERGGATFVDPLSWFCKEDRSCPPVIDGVVVRSDPTHTTDQFASLLGQKLAIYVR